MASQCSRYFVFGTLVFVLFIWHCYCQMEPNPRSQRRRQRNRNPARRSNSNMDPILQQAYVAAYDGGTSPGPTQATGPEVVDEPLAETARSTNPWVAFTPNLPSANEVECSVVVMSIRQQGGRCTQLGGLHRPYICQSGAHFEFKPECERVIMAREAAYYANQQPVS